MKLAENKEDAEQTNIQESKHQSKKWRSSGEEKRDMKHNYLILKTCHRINPWAVASLNRHAKNHVFHQIRKTKF